MLTPIENAIEVIDGRCQFLLTEINCLPPSPKSLQNVLQGSVLAREFSWPRGRKCKCTFFTHWLSVIFMILPPSLSLSVSNPNHMQRWMLDQCTSAMFSWGMQTSIPSISYKGYCHLTLSFSHSLSSFLAPTLTHSCSNHSLRPNAGISTGWPLCFHSCHSLFLSCPPYFHPNTLTPAFHTTWTLYVHFLLAHRFHSLTHPRTHSLIVALSTLLTHTLIHSWRSL